MKIQFNKKPSVTEQEKDLKNQQELIKQQYDRIKKLKGD